MSCTKKLCEVGKIITGNTPPTSQKEYYSSNDIYFVKPSDFCDTSITSIHNSVFYISDSAKGIARIVPSGSVFITCIGIIGKIAIAVNECAFNQQINAIIPNHDSYGRYLAYALLSKKQKMNSIANAAVVPIINKTQLSNIDIRFPSFDSQREIAATLDAVSEVLRLRKAQLAELDNLVKSKFVEMFGDPVTNPKQWPEIRLSEIGTFKNGMNYRRGDSGFTVHCLGVGDFRSLSSIDGTNALSTVSLNQLPSSEYFLQDGDIVFVRSNGNRALVGRCLVVYPYKTPTIFSGFCIRFRVTTDMTHAEYLQRVLTTESMQRKIAGRGANIQNLNQEMLKSLNIPVPPSSLQEAYSHFLHCIDQQKQSIQQSLDETQRLFDSLMAEYFEE